MTPRDGVKGSFLAGKNDPLSPSPRVIFNVMGKTAVACILMVYLYNEI